MQNVKAGGFEKITGGKCHELATTHGGALHMAATDSDVEIADNDDAVVRLAGAKVCEQNDARAVQRARHMILETIAQMNDDRTISLPVLAH